MIEYYLTHTDVITYYLAVAGIVLIIPVCLALFVWMMADFWAGVKAFFVGLVFVALVCAGAMLQTYLEKTPRPVPTPQTEIDR
jgi:hypothetical protein